MTLTQDFIAMRNAGKIVPVALHKTTTQPYPITYPYGTPNPRYTFGKHTGDDHACPVGSRAVAPSWGRVIYAGHGSGNWGAAYGLQVVIRMADNTHDYAHNHLSRIDVKEGDYVLPGTVVGLVGVTGTVTGPHTHFEARPIGGRYGSDVNPMAVRKMDAVILPPKPPKTPEPGTPKDAVLAVVFYNIDNNRNSTQVNTEIRALANPKKGRQPKIIGLSEAIRYPNLPDLEGYRLIRDRSSRSRDNIAAYVHESLDVSGVRWHDMETPWVRPKGGGMHEPRSFLEFFVGEVQVIIGHMAQLSAKGAPAAQAEQLGAMIDLMAPWTLPGWRSLPADQKQFERERPRLLLWDRNRATIAKKIRAVTVGDKIDRAEIRNMEAISHAYKTESGGVRLLSNHGHAFRAVLEVEKSWLHAA